MLTVNRTTSTQIPKSWLENQNLTENKIKQKNVSKSKPNRDKSSKLMRGHREREREADRQNQRD